MGIQVGGKVASWCLGGMDAPEKVSVSKATIKNNFCSNTFSEIGNIKQLLYFLVIV